MLSRVTATALVVAAAAATLFAIGVIEPRVLGAVAGPEGIIHARHPLALPEELDVLKGRALGAAAPLGLAAAVLAAAAVMLWRPRVAPVIATVLALALGGSLFNDFVIRPAVSARESLKPFAARVDALAAASPDGAPFVLCAGEAYELRYYLRAHSENIKPEDADAFLKRLQPDGASAGEPVRVILRREWLDGLEKQTGPLKVLLATGPGEGREMPMVVVLARRRTD